MIIFNNKNFFLTVFFLSVGSIFGAIYIEYFLNVKACALCIYQRLPYLAAIFVCFLGINYHKNILWNYLIIVVFLISAGLSGYHIGIENGFFVELASCKNESINVTDKEKLLESMKTINVSCKDVNFTILGFSLATINLIISLTVVALGTIYIYHEKN